MGIFMVLIAGIFASFSNFCMRRSIDGGGTTKAFLMIQLSIAAIAALLLGPVRTQQFTCNASVVCLGLGAGLVLSLMFVALGKALERGPPGLTFAALSSSTIMPAIVMATMFGASFGCVYTMWHATGSLLVLAGLFWAGKGLDGIKDKNSWLIFVTLMFTFHLLFLVILQWRALILNWPSVEQNFLFTSEQMASQWFMPLIYFAAALMQIVLYFTSEKTIPKPTVCTYGLFGGIANALSTFFLIWGTEVANALENAVLFPIFSVSIIVLCNLWGQKFYQEQVNWRACQVCMFGLAIGTVDWKSLFS